MKKKPNKTNTNSFLFVKGIDSKLKKKFKLKCYLEGFTMTDAIVGFMQAYVNEKRETQ